MVTPEDFLKFAEDIEKNLAPSEMQRRMAVGRAYYALLHFIIRDLGIRVEDGAGRTHQLISDALFSLPVASTKTYQQNAKYVFNSMKLARVTADYYTNVAVTEKDMQIALQRARSVFSGAAN